MPARRVVDLSHPLGPTTPVYPGDPLVRFSPHATVARDGAAVLRVEMGSHTGTHVDAPCHVLEGAAGIDELDPGLFVGPGVVVDVRHRGASEAITAEDVAAAVPRLAPGVIVLCWTGWSSRWGEASYLDHPHLGVDACRILLDVGVRTIGLDVPSIDRPLDDALPCHHLVAEAGGVVVENLTRLAESAPTRSSASCRSGWTGRTAHRSGRWPSPSADRLRMRGAGRKHFLGVSCCHSVASRPLRRLGKPPPRPPFEEECMSAPVHAHEHTHEGETHAHEHDAHEHTHDSHTHAHSHGDETHEHAHAHDAAVEHTHHHH